MSLDTIAVLCLVRWFSRTHDARSARHFEDGCITAASLLKFNVVLLVTMALRMMADKAIGPFARYYQRIVGAELQKVGE